MERQVSLGVFESDATPLEYQVVLDKEGLRFVHYSLSVLWMVDNSCFLRNMDPFLKVETLLVVYTEILMVLPKG